MKTENRKEEKEFVDANKEINSALNNTEKTVKEGVGSIEAWAKNLKDRFAPEDQKKIEFNDDEAVVTLTKQCSVILTFSNQEDAKIYFEKIVQ